MRECGMGCAVGISIQVYIDRKMCYPYRVCNTESGISGTCKLLFYLRL